ncbi:hypothetical protein [Hymenobacter norwichensis]|uniref:hypothetical protein n=1 Tax=Hymenobacter norwichensis TaxID=223903 RepID=UPI0003B6E44D|nr:hypothetical protein [Hymenobacter norwichensis]
MKKSFVLLSVALLLGYTAPAQTMSAAPKQLALARQLNQLMRDPAKPKQDVLIALNSCHVQQIIRDRDADVNLDNPLAMSFASGKSGWAVSSSNGFFELKMDFEWSDVTAVSYARSDDKDSKALYEIQIKRQKKNSTTNSELQLYTTDEAVVKNLVAQLNKLRQGCNQ